MIMKEYEPTNLEIAEIFLRVLCDKAPEKADVLFIHSSFKDQYLEDCLTREATFLWQKGKCEFIVINGMTSLECAKENNISNGSEKYIERLISGGVLRDNILLIPSSHNTAEESQNILKMAKEKNWQTLLVMSTPHHQVRCFLTIVSTMEELDIHIKVYNTTFHNVDWDMKVVRKVLGGQNVLGQKDEEGSFISLMKGELERIKRYAIPSSNYNRSATIKEALDYLEKRDK